MKYKYNTILSIFLFLASQVTFAQLHKDIETLVSTDVTTINPDGSAVKESERVYKIITESGRAKLAYDTANFNSATQNFQIVEAFVLNQTQKTIVDPSKISITALPQAGPGLGDFRQAVIPLPMLKVGSVATVKYKLVSKPRTGKLFSDAMSISNNELAKQEFYIFKSKSVLSVYEENTGKYYKVEKSVDPKTQENIVKLMPTEWAYISEGVQIESAVVFVSNAEKWSDLNQEIAGRYNSAVDMPLPQEFQAIANEAKAISSSKQQIEFVTSKLAKVIAYSGDWSTVTGQMFPKGHQKVVKDGNGDCKDYSTSLAAILRKLGYQSNVALSFRSRRYSGIDRLKKLAAIPMLTIFNHAIVWAKDKAGAVWWLDPTNPLVIADMLAADILGNFALVLDGKSNQVEFLPEKNVNEIKVEISQEISINPDFSVSGSGLMKMDKSTYNSIAIAERSQGIETTNKIVAATLNFGMPKKLELDKIEGEVPQYKINFVGTQWIAKSGTQAGAITLISPVALYLIENRPKADGDLGEPGTFELKTVVKNSPLYDGVEGSCYVRSKWIDFDRVVKPVVNDIQITDLIRIKTRFISKEDASTKDYETTYSSLMECARNNKIVMFLNQKEKTQEFIEMEAKKGPSVEKMTDADAEKLDNLPGPILYSYRAKKLIQYYSKKIEENPKDAKAYSLRASNWPSLGYRSGDDYVPEHLDVAIDDLSKAIESSGTIDGKMYFKKIKFLTYRNKMSEATGEFLKLHKANSKDFYTAVSAIQIGRKQKNYAFAEQWGKAVDLQNRTNDEKEIYYYQMQRLMAAQNKSEEAIRYQEKLIESNPDDPWQLHNLAIEYFDKKNYDRIIELETKALAIMEFGMARKTLADAYFYKAKDLSVSMMNLPKREPSSVSKMEEFVLSALKWDPSHKQALVHIATHYLNEASRTRDKTYMAKGRPYLERLLQEYPGDRSGMIVQSIYTTTQKHMFPDRVNDGK